MLYAMLKVFCDVYDATASQLQALLTRLHPCDPLSLLFAVSVSLSLQRSASLNKTVVRSIIGGTGVFDDETSQLFITRVGTNPTGGFNYVLRSSAFNKTEQGKSFEEHHY